MHGEGSRIGGEGASGRDQMMNLSECLKVEFSDENGSPLQQQTHSHNKNPPQKENLSFSLQQFQKSSHVLLHFLSGYYARKVWERYNGRMLNDVLPMGLRGTTSTTTGGISSQQHMIHPNVGESLLRMTLWTEDDDDLTPVNATQNVFGSATSSIVSRENLAQQQQNHSLSSNSTPMSSLFCSGAHAEDDSTLHDTSRKRKRENANMDDLTSTLQSLMTPYVKRRKRARSVDALDQHSNTSMSGTPLSCGGQRNTLTVPPHQFRSDKDAMMEDLSPNEGIMLGPKQQQSMHAQRNVLYTPDGFTIQRPLSPPLSAPAGTSNGATAPKTPTRKRLPSSMRRQRAYSPPPMNEKYAKVLKIDNLTSTTREEDVRRALAKYGSWNIQWIKVVQREQSIKQRAFVLFEHAFEALEAKNIINFRILVDSMVSASIATQADFFWLQKIVGEHNPINSTLFVNNVDQQQYGHAFSSYRRLFESNNHEDENMGDSDEEDSFKSVRQSLFQQQQQRDGNEKMMG